MSVLLRTMTLKSKINIGKYKKETVEMLIGMRKQKDLISMYYKLTSVNFNEEVLNLLGITGKYIIDKPSVNKELYYTFLKDTGYIKDKKQKKANRNKDMDKMKKQPSVFSKRSLQSINQGR